MRKHYTHHGLRRMKTTQERRANGKRCFLHIDDYKVKIRPKRNMSNLPEAWDDYWIYVPKCWKNHRKTQYKQDKHSVFFNMVGYGDLFKIGGRTYRKIDKWHTFRRPFMDAVELETGREIKVDWYAFVEWPIEKESK